MENSERFIKIYNELDQYMREELGEENKVSHVFLIDRLAKKSNLFRHYKNDLKEFAELRNAIIHNTHFSGNRYGDVIAEPHDVVVEMYEELLLKITKPQNGKDIYRKIDSDEVVVGTKDSLVMDLIKSMYNKDITCVPILENNKLVGVFSENVLLSLIAENKNTEFNKIKITDILEFIDIDNHQGEYFAFCKIKENIFDIKELFSSRRDKKRLELVFVTGNGSRNEDILGVISAWDLV